MRHPRRFSVRAGRWAMCVAAALSLTACGGGSSGGSGSPGGTTTYTIGGSVSGLTSSGLTLTDNGSDTLTVPAQATTFTFSQALQSGATYAVAIATQPSNEQCQVSSASGTVSGNVTSVVVVCTQLDTIGGAVSGLSAAGLVLELNGQYSLSVPANASSYVFSQGLAAGTAYQVTIATQPNDESCAVSPSAGTVSGNVTNVNVTCSLTAYSISGTISGLSASGLKLQFYSSGPQLSVAAGATTFTYGNVPYGTNVAMDVVTQPDWQWCTPGSSDYSGPVTSNITGENLSCAAAQADVTTLAGSTTPGSANGTGSAAAFDDPAGVAVNAAGDIYVADSANNEIREVTPAGVVTTLAGSTTAGSADGTGSAASFDAPDGVAVNASGDIYVADSGNNEIRMITPAGVVTTLAGSTTAGSADGTGSAASFYHPTGVALDASGNIYVADFGNNEIREITSGGVVTTLAGSTTAGDANGTGSAASFSGPLGVAVDASGTIYVTDSLNNEIRAVTGAGVVTTLAGSPVAGSANGTGSAASFDTPFGITVVQASGVLYVGGFANEEIRQITPGP